MPNHTSEKNELKIDKHLLFIDESGLLLNTHLSLYC